MANEEKYFPPLHPGEILREEFMKPLRMSQTQLAKALGVDTQLIRRIVQGKRGIDAEMAMRLDRCFGMGVQFWLGLQAHYELDCVRYAERTQSTRRFDFIRRILPKGAAAL